MNAKELVSEYMRTVWVEKNVPAIERFVDANLIQHNPNLPNGRDALAAFVPGLFNEMPNLQWRILRIIAEGDMVVVHSHAVPAPDARGTMVVDLFRVADGRIVEHWDVTQPVPESSASGNAMD